MIDRPSRDAFALALRRYAGRRISSDDLDDLVLARTDDAGLTAIKGVAWTLYSDLDDHRAEGRYALTLAQRKDIARWIFFLRSEIEYAYPAHLPEKYVLARAFAPVLNVLSFGAFGRWLVSKDRAFSDAGDLSVWPFESRRQLRRELERVQKSRKP
jgi:hypothetical protein